MNKNYPPEDHRLFFAKFMEYCDTPSLERFLKNNYSTSIEKENLFKFIINTSFFFNFRISSTDRENIEKESFKRMFPFFKIFSLNQQIALLNSPLHDFNISNFEYFKNLNINQSDLNNINSNNLSFLLTDLFNKEYFHILDYLEDKLNKNINNNFSNIFSVHYKEDYSHGCFNVFMDKSSLIYKPLYDIIFNYTVNKKDYIISKNLELPSQEEVNNLSSEVLKYMVNYSSNNIDLFVQKTSDYSKIILPFELNKILPPKGSVNLRKI